MKKMLMNKKFVQGLTATIVMLLLLLFTTGCNQQIIDFNYTFDKAICNIGNEIKEIKIDKWNDYDGEQLQIIDDKGNVYLISSYNCTLIKEK